MPGQMESAFLARFEHKKDDVKHRLNEIVDDLFAYLAVELTRLAQPPDRVASASHQQVLSQQQQLLPPPPLPPVPTTSSSSSNSLIVPISNASPPKRAPLQVLDVIKHEPPEASTTCLPLNNQQQMSCTESSVPPTAATTPPPPLPSVYTTAANHMHNNHHITTIVSSVSTAILPSTSTASSSSSSFGVLNLSNSNVSAAATAAPVVLQQANVDELIELDDEDEHSDSDCDCEQCMGVPICSKVDIIGDISDRPAKRQRGLTNSNSSGGGGSGGGGVSSVDNVDYPDEPEGEQCSATFKTISIKCSQDDCPSMFKNKVERNQHLLYQHGIQPYTCLMGGCKKGFDNVRQYGEHVNVEHRDVSSWPCNKCPKVCTDHRLLCRHIYFYHQEGRFKCRKSKCNFVAPYRIEVRRHAQLHTEMYACQFGCGKSFSHTHHRKRHERIHLRLKPFRCKWPNCGYCSEARSTVIRHIRIRHFNLPLTLKQQNELNIVDNRDPRDYMEILAELMN